MMRSLLAATQSLLLLLLLSSSSVLCESDVSTTAPMERTELEALFLVIQGFVGNWWNGSELYPDPCGWTPIQGVSCDFFNGFWYVAVLNIGPVFDNSLVCALDAKFSPYLFEFMHLRSLSFFNCFTSMYHPELMPSNNWEKLSSSLETLEFRSNQGLIGEVPASFGRLRDLQSLVLVDNALAGELPPELGNLVQLKRLSLSGNGFSGQIPASFGNSMSELLILDLSMNSLSGPLPSSLGGLTSLLKLDLSNNHLYGKLPNELGKLMNLSLLDLRNNSLSGGLVEALQGMVSLQDMLLSNNPLGGNVMEFGWKNLKDLTNLDLSNMNLTGKIPESIMSLRKLRFLSLENNQLSGTVSPKLADLPSLNAIYLSGNNLTGELQFSEEFYERMGRRFANWDNPNLCYNADLISTEHAPVGVQQCKKDQEASIYYSDPKSKVVDENPDHSSSLMVSFGSSTFCETGLWCVIVMQQWVMIFLFALVL